MLSEELYQRSKMRYESKCFDVNREADIVYSVSENVQDVKELLALPAYVTAIKHCEYYNDFSMKNSGGSTYTLIFVLRGQLACMNGVASKYINSFEGLFIQDNDYFELKQGNDEPLELWMIGCGGSTVSTFYSLFQKEKRALYINDFAELMSLFQLLTQYHEMPDIEGAVWTAHTMSRILSILYLWKRTLIASGKSIHQPLWIYETVLYMEKHLEEELKIPELAAKYELSQSYFGRKFKEYTGCTPYQYLIRLRIKRAEMLLVTTRLQIKFISATVGFPSVNHFISHFQQAYGMTPAAYRAGDKHFFDGKGIG